MLTQLALPGLRELLAPAIWMFAQANFTLDFVRQLAEDFGQPGNDRRLAAADLDAGLV